jgi:hypothetical protein
VKQHWDDQALAEHWSLTDNERTLLANRADRSRLGFAVLIKFIQVEGRFPRNRREVPADGVRYLAKQLTVPAETFRDYDLTGRNSERHRAQIRSLLGFRPFDTEDADRLAAWLREELFPVDQTLQHLQASVLDWCRENRVEPPTPGRAERIIRSAVRTYESGFYQAIFGKLSAEHRQVMDALLDSAPVCATQPGTSDGDQG